MKQLLLVAVMLQLQVHLQAHLQEMDLTLQTYHQVTHSHIPEVL